MKNLLIVIAFFAIGAISAQTTTAVPAPPEPMGDSDYIKCVKACQAEFPTPDGPSQVTCISGCAGKSIEPTSTPALPKPKKDIQAPKPGTVKGQ